MFLFFAYVVSLHSFRWNSRAMDLSFAHPHHVSWLYLSILLHVVNAIFFTFVTLVEFIYSCELRILVRICQRRVFKLTITRIDDIDNYSQFTLFMSCLIQSIDMEPSSVYFYNYISGILSFIQFYSRSMRTQYA